MNFEQNMNMDDLSGYINLVSAKREDKLYAVPEHYFETLCMTILARIKWNSVQQAEIYAVPETYFLDFPDKILMRIRALEEESISPVLKSLSKEDVYSVPDGYFNNFSRNFSSVIGNGHKNKGAKIIPLVSKRKSWRMAVAAAVVSAVVLSSGLILENNKQQPKAKTPYAAVIQKDLSSLSNGDIADYLSAPDASIDEEPVYESSDTDTKNELKNISGSEVEAYLNQTPAIY